MQLLQDDGWHGLERARQRPWKGHHCSAGGHKGGSLINVWPGTQTATGEQAGPPQPATEHGFSSFSREYTETAVSNANYAMQGTPAESFKYYL